MPEKNPQMRPQIPPLDAPPIQFGSYLPMQSMPSLQAMPGINYPPQMPPPSLTNAQMENNLNPLEKRKMSLQSEEDSSSESGIDILN